MKITRKVQVKQIVTEKSKAKLQHDLHKRKMQLEQECQQLLFEKRKLQNKHGMPKQEVARRFQQEIDQRKEDIQLVDFKLEQLDMLEMGTELVEGEVEALVEVTEGVSWNDITKKQSIIIKDDKVIRID